MPWTSECIHLLMADTHILRTNQCDLRDKSFTLKCQTAFTPTKLMVLLLCASWLLNVIDHHCNRQHAKPINMCANAAPTHTHTQRKNDTPTHSRTTQSGIEHLLIEYFKEFWAAFQTCMRVSSVQIQRCCLHWHRFTVRSRLFTTTGKNKRNATTFRWAWPLAFPITPLRKHYSAFLTNKSIDFISCVALYHFVLLKTHSVCVRLFSALAHLLVQLNLPCNCCDFI